MKAIFLLLGVVADAGLAQPHLHARGHSHGHAHHHHGVAHAKRDVFEEHVSVTVVECWLGGSIISESDCKQGISNGTLRWADDGSLAIAKPSTSIIAVPHPAPTVAAPKPAIVMTPKKQSAPVAPVAPAAPVAPPQPVQAKPAMLPPVNKVAQSASSSSSSSAATVNRAFPDGELDCSTFPSEYGAVRTDWLGLGGWAGVQKPGQDGAAGYSDILTVTPAQCVGDNCCLNGSFCSYACPDGYLKWQWPSKQGATGQSVGGLSCQNGKLYLSNPSQGTLCAAGTSNVNVYVQNKMSKNVAICRTNYPGDEKMSIPVDAQPGSTHQLACPDAATYYRWQGKGTSAQYYINLPGYSVDQACVWGNQGDNYGNFAPANLGVGFSNGRAWLSIAQNLPTQPNVVLPYTVEIRGDTISDTCRYQNGRYCSGPNYSTCSTGCTVSASGGNVYYVLSD